MKVKDLIAALERQDADAEVFYAYPSGDYWRSIIAGPTGSVNVRTVQESGYHDGMVVVHSYNADDGYEIVNAVVIAS